MAERLAHNLGEGVLGRLLPSMVGAASCDAELAVVSKACPRVGWR